MPGAPLSLDPARIWAFARHTSWVEGRGGGGNLDGAYKKGTAPSGVAAVVASTAGLGFLRSYLTSVKLSRGIKMLIKLVTNSVPPRRI